jgi:hypothetical protein
VEEIAYGITRQWLYVRRAEIITPTTAQRFTSQNPRITTALFFDRAVALQWLVSVGIPPDE